MHNGPQKVLNSVGLLKFMLNFTGGGQVSSCLLGMSLPDLQSDSDPSRWVVLQAERLTNLFHPYVIYLSQNELYEFGPETRQRFGPASSTAGGGSPLLVCNL